MDGIEKEYREQLLVIRVDIQSQAGRELRNLYQAQYTPTFIFFNATGEELWRSVGQLDAGQVHESLTDQP